MFPQLGQFTSYSVETLAGQSQVSDSVVLKVRLKSQIESIFWNLQEHVRWKCENYMTKFVKRNYSDHDYVISDVTVPHIVIYVLRPINILQINGNIGIILVS